MPTRKPAIKGLLAELVDEVDIPEPLVITDDITISMPSRTQMIAYYEADTAEGRNRAIFGQHFDELEAIFGDEPAQLWNAFVDRVSEHFFGSGSTKVEGN